MGKRARLANKSTKCSGNARRKLQKGGGKSNITAKRLTIAPSFINYNINNNTEYHNNQSTERIIDDETNSLHGLFYDKINESQRLRRSWRLSRKYSHHQSSSAGKSKSLFKEINEKFKGIQLDSNTTSATAVNNNNNSSSSSSSLFCGNLWTKLFETNRIRQRPIEIYKQRIKNEIQLINEIIIGGDKNINSGRRRRIMSNQSIKLQQINEIVDENNKENNLPSMKFHGIPKSKWIYQTPPNRKFNFDYNNIIKNNGGGQNTLEPAVIASINRKKIMYEMNKNINIDLSKFTNHQTVDVDKRFMTEIATFTIDNNNKDENYLMEVCSTSSSSLQPPPPPLQQQYNIIKPSTQQSSNNEQLCTFLKPKLNDLEAHFLSLTARPKRKIIASSRKSTMKPKRHIFDTQTSCSSSASALLAATATTTHLLSDFTIIEDNNNDMDVSMEQSFTFKFSQTNEAAATATTTTTSTTTTTTTSCQLFDFHGEIKDSFNFQPEN